MRRSTHAPDCPNPAPAPTVTDADAWLDVQQAVDAALAAVGVDRDAAGVGQAREQLARFVATLLRENERLGLTTIRDPREAVQRHVAEPLAGWRAIAAAVPDGPIAEVGSGGGAPGLPIAILATDREVTLVEARTRRAAYLRDLVDDLGLRNVRVVEERGEAFAADGDEGRERYACAMGRALAKLPVALEILLPLVQVGGLAAVFAGPGASRWLADAGQVAGALGAEPPVAQTVTWPGAPLRLSMVTCRKSSRTPGRFPRAVRRMRHELPPPP